MSSVPKTINILGATGSIGQSAADIILSAPARFDVHCVTANHNAEKLAEMAVKLNARRAVLADTTHYKLLREHLSGTTVKLECGSDALAEAAGEKADITLAAIVGLAGLKPLIKALENSACVAIANKEPLVAAGPFVMEKAKKHGTKILPVDSEHNAVFQVFDFENVDAIQKIILTASGGPFRTWSLEEMRNAEPQQALAHPNWSMGAKISVDSATMMNKALEIIEAHVLFNVPPEKIEVLIHPQSVVHSMVEYNDGSILAQMGASDMRTPLSNVLNWPERMDTPGRRLDLTRMRRLDFEEPDFKKFPALGLAYSCLKRGLSACVALNAANEIATQAFFNRDIGFLDIYRCADHIHETVKDTILENLRDIEIFDRKVRNMTLEYIKNNTDIHKVKAI